ncbi:hypothetical protein [Lacrimispora sp.]|uniref:hypothetical protein n=1 Tax=Lacrimispora sp. TaxID=2719234 RepID=UPI002FDA4088
MINKNNFDKYEFAKEEVFVLSDIFELIFGDFLADIYGEALAQAFDEKISSLAASM